MKLTDQLLAVTRAYSAARGISTARLSTLLFNDGKCLRRVEAGSDIRTGTYEAALQWLSANWPEGAQWPAEITRPAPVPASTLEAAS